MTEATEHPMDIDIIWPTVLALRKLARPACPEEINALVPELGNFTDAQKALRTVDGYSLIGYRSQWVRAHLRQLGAVTGPAIWELTALGWRITEQECRDSYNLNPGR